MNTNRFFNLLTVLCFVGFPILTIGQRTFHSFPVVKETDDSIFYETSDKYFFDYFSGRMDSIVDNFNTFEAAKLQQKAAISRENGNGYLRILMEGRPLFEYSIRDNKVEGIGIVYNNVLSDAGEILQKGVFKDNKLNGVLLYFGHIRYKLYRIDIYRKGKYKKTIFFDDTY